MKINISLFSPPPALSWGLGFAGFLQSIFAIDIFFTFLTRLDGLLFFFSFFLFLFLPGLFFWGGFGFVPFGGSFFDYDDNGNDNDDEWVVSRRYNDWNQNELSHLISIVSHRFTLVRPMLMQHLIPDRHKSSQNYSVHVSDKGIPYGIDTEGFLTINRRLWNCLIFINGPAENEANHHDPEVRTPKKMQDQKIWFKTFPANPVRKDSYDGARRK